MHACNKCMNLCSDETVMGMNVLKTFAEIKPSLLNNSIANG